MTNGQQRERRDYFSKGYKCICLILSVKNVIYLIYAVNSIGLKINNALVVKVNSSWSNSKSVYTNADFLKDIHVYRTTYQCI